MLLFVYFSAVHLVCGELISTLRVLSAAVLHLLEGTFYLSTSFSSSSTFLTVNCEETIKTVALTIYHIYTRFSKFLTNVFCEL